MRRRQARLGGEEEDCNAVRLRQGGAQPGPGRAVAQVDIDQGKVRAATAHQAQGFVRICGDPDHLMSEVFERGLHVDRNENLVLDDQYPAAHHIPQHFRPQNTDSGH